MTEQGTWHARVAKSVWFDGLDRQNGDIGNFGNFGSQIENGWQLLGGGGGDLYLTLYITTHILV
jgi:hypothetical protein